MLWLSYAPLMNELMQAYHTISLLSLLSFFDIFLMDEIVDPIADFLLSPIHWRRQKATNGGVIDGGY